MGLQTSQTTKIASENYFRSYHTITEMLCRTERHKTYLNEISLACNKGENTCNTLNLPTLKNGKYLQECN